VPLLPPLRADEDGGTPTGGPRLHEPVDVEPPDGVRRFEPGDAFLIQVGMLAAAIGLVLDQSTKELAETLLVRSRLVEVFGEGWGWQLVYNPGGAFGFGAPTAFFLGVTVVVAFIVARNLPKVTRVSGAVAYGMLLAGALGNALDRVFRSPGFLRGEVVDFIAIRLPFYGDFPRFNVADMAIISGFVLLMITLWREDLEHAAAQRRGEASGTGAGPETQHAAADVTTGS
jgi:signal peptidase II